MMTATARPVDARHQQQESGSSVVARRLAPGRGNRRTDIAGAIWSLGTYAETISVESAAMLAGSSEVSFTEAVSLTKMVVGWSTEPAIPLG
jgi:hypothetical protein